MSYYLCSKVIYKFSCGRRNATYFSETCWHLSVRVGEHLSVSTLTGKKSESKKSTAVKDHMLFCDNIVSIDDFKLLSTSDSEGGRGGGLKDYIKYCIFNIIVSYFS